MPLTKILDMSQKTKDFNSGHNRYCRPSNSLNPQALRFGKWTGKTFKRFGSQTLRFTQFKLQNEENTTLTTALGMFKLLACSLVYHCILWWPFWSLWVHVHCSFSSLLSFNSSSIKLIINPTFFPVRGCVCETPRCTKPLLQNNTGLILK